MKGDPIADYMAEEKKKDTLAAIRAKDNLEEIRCECIRMALQVLSAPIPSYGMKASDYEKRARAVSVYLRNAAMAAQLLAAERKAPK